MVIFLSQTCKNLFQLVFEPDFGDPDFDLDCYLEPARSCAWLKIGQTGYSKTTGQSHQYFKNRKRFSTELSRSLSRS